MRKACLGFHQKQNGSFIVGHDCLSVCLCLTVPADMKKQTSLKRHLSLGLIKYHAVNVYRSVDLDLGTR
jgi:hypothetical protein